MTGSGPFPLTIGNVLLCEDVREEVHGKFSAFGIYAGDVLVGHFAGVMRAAIYLELFSKTPGRVEVELEVFYNNDNRARVVGELDFKNLTDPGILAFPTFPLAIAGPGKIRVVLTSGGKRKTILTRAVRLDASLLPSTASPPPPARSPSGARKKAKKP